MMPFKNIFTPKNALGISDFAKQLIDALDLRYDKYGDVSTTDGIQLIFKTPTIFIAHSSLISNLCYLNVSINVN